MHILMLTSDFYPIVGGAEKQAERLSEQLTKQGHKVTVITKSHKGLKKRELYKGYYIQRVKVFNKNKLKPYFYLLQVLWFLLKKRKKIDVIHAHTISAAGLSAALASFFFRVPSIVKIPGGNKDGSQIKRLSKTRSGNLKLNILKKNITKFIAISRDIEFDLYNLEIPHEKIELLPNGVDIDAFKPTNFKNVDKDSIIYVGRLEYVKGIDFLVKSWRKLNKDVIKNSTLTILGEGSIHIRNELNHSINYVGKVSNVIDYLNVAEYYILPSRYEGISNSLLEALANGKIVIASNVGGNPDLIINGENGFLFKCEDFDSLRETLIKVFNLSKSERETIKYNAIKTVENQYNLRDISDRYLKLYKEIL